MRGHGSKATHGSGQAKVCFVNFEAAGQSQTHRQVHRVGAWVQNPEKLLGENMSEDFLLTVRRVKWIQKAKEFIAFNKR